MTDETLLRAALTDEVLEELLARGQEAGSAAFHASGRDLSAGMKAKYEAMRDVLVAALAGRFVDDTHHCAKCGIRWTGVAGAVYCGDCHRAALAGRPEAETDKLLDSRSRQVLGHTTTPTATRHRVVPNGGDSGHSQPAEAGRPDAEAQATYPLQPKITDKDGVERFKANEIVRYLADWCAGFNRSPGYSPRDAPAPDLNQLASLPFSAEDRQQFAQLIGYSISGYGELSYVDDAAWTRAEEADKAEDR